MPHPETNESDRTAPAVTDQKSCERWLQKTPLADSRQACFELTALLEEIEDAPPAARHWLAILETLRKPILVAQNENAKKFAGRPIPLGQQEAAAFDQVFDLWRTYGRAYKRLAVEVSEDLTHPLSTHLALLIARALEALCELKFVHYRAHREIDGELWQELNQLFAMAESSNVEHDMSDEDGMMSPAPFEHFMRELLLHLAQPYALTSRELEWTRRWTRNWSQKPLFTFPSETDEILAIDLEGSGPARRVRGGQGGDGYRYIDLSQLRRSVRKRISGLKQERTPAELGLGSDCNPQEAAELLSRLHMHWFETVARQFKRRPVTGRVELACSFADAHLAIGGRVARGQQQRAYDYARRDPEQMLAYGTGEHSLAEVTEDMLAIERWEMLDDSANGFRVRRKGAGGRVAHMQLIGLRPPGAPTFILCEIRWLSEGLDGTVTMGVQALPGLAEPVSVRPEVSLDAAEEPFHPAFLLPGGPGRPPSLVTRLGTFRPGRTLDMKIEDEVRRLRVDTLVKQGHDYERSLFQALT